MFLYSLSFNLHQRNGRERQRSSSLDRSVTRTFNEYLCPRSYSSPASTRIFDTDESSKPDALAAESNSRYGEIAISEFATVGSDAGSECTQTDTMGTLHLYRDLDSIRSELVVAGSGDGGLQSKLDTLTQQALLGGRVLCVLAVPSYFTTTDFFAFLGPFQSQIERLRILRDSRPGRFLSVITMKTVQGALEFYSEYNARLFDDLVAEEVCHMVFLRSVTVHSSDVSVCERFSDLMPAGSELSTPVVELPTCPVCLERMDSSKSGIFTSVCSHSFHCRCISQWRDGSCPVCRHSLKGADDSDDMGNGDANSDCSQCQSCGRSDDLWICLVCGNVGCGRYAGRHAHNHYKTANHWFALHIGTGRVWDYASDVYVHRLVQNSADGKIVEVGEAESPSSLGMALVSNTSEPVDDSNSQRKEAGKQNERKYASLVTAQLESQREFYEAHICELESRSSKQALALSALTLEGGALKTENARLSSALKETDALLREQQHDSDLLIADLRDQLASAKKQLSKALAAVKDESALSSSISENCRHLSEQLQTEKAANAELKEQVRDLMFFIDGSQKIAAGGLQDELKDATITIGPSASKRKTKSRQRK